MKLILERLIILVENL